jgi:hypothetical protein
MKRCISLRQIVLALIVPAVWCLAGPLQAARAQSFSATGSFVSTARHGNIFSGTVAGDSDPLGMFTGTFTQKATGNTLEGSTTFNCNSTDSVTIAYELELDSSTGIYSGTWSVTGGTGTLSAASGFGDLTVQQGSTGDFSVTGILSP